MNKKSLLLSATICLLTLGVFAQNTVFTYQGLLNTNGAPYSGSAEMLFTIWDAATNGNSVATNNAGSVIANVANGIFTVPLDFGINPFNGDARFLEASVRTVIGPFTTLAPRQPLTATPYALRALNLTTNGLVSGTYGNALTFNNAGNSFSGSFNGGFNGSFVGDGSTISNVNAITLGGVPSTGYWKTNGNAGANPTNGAFIGTTDPMPLELRVNGHRALRLEPDVSGFSPNVLGGSESSSIQAGELSSTISGGGENNILLSSGRSGEANSTIGGGGDNMIGATAGGNISLFGGGDVIAGGFGNNIRARADFSAIGGGEYNVIATASQFGTIPGGDQNAATNHAFAAGHRAKANHDGSFVWADSTDADFTSTATNQFLIRANGGVGIGTASPTRELEIQHNGDVELGLKSTDAGGHLWTLQSSSLTGSSNLDASFQIIDRTSGGARLLIGTNGNIGIGTNNPTQRLSVFGNIIATGTVNGSSDRNIKENFKPINASEVLEKVAGLPITRWNYKADAEVTHLGPMAQDFYAAFDLGMDDKHISMVDADGVALAAIQGLNRKLQEESKAKDEEITELKARLEKLERLIAKMDSPTRD